MSADNGIYILVTKSGYYVKHLQSIERLHWNAENDEHTAEININSAYEMFKDAEVVGTQKEALNIAIKINGEVAKDSDGITEHGIQTIFGLEDVEFPSGDTN